MQRSLITEVTIPDEFICPILRDIMNDPFMTPTGRSFEKQEIVTWVQAKHTDPFNQSNQSRISEKNLVPNNALKLAIADYKQISKESVSLLEIYHQRGSEKIQELKNYLSEIKTHLAIEEKGQEAKFVINRSTTIWPFPVICPRSGFNITDPIIEADGTTYQRPKESKQQHSTNLNLKSVLHLFSIKPDNKLNFQINKIKRLIKQINQANEKLLAFQRVRVEARRAEAEREQQELRRALAEAKKIEQQKRKKKYLCGAAAAVATCYAAMCVYDYFYGDDPNKQNEINSTTDYLSMIAKPVFTSFAVLHGTFSRWIQQMQAWNDKVYYDNVFRDCKIDVKVFGKFDKWSQSSCKQAVNLALKYKDKPRLRILENNATGFGPAMRQALENKNFADLRILHELSRDQLNYFMYLDKQLGQVAVEFLLEHDPICPSSRPSPLATNLRNLYESRPLDGYVPSSLVIAIGNNNLELVKKILDHDLPLAKKIMKENEKLMNWTTKLSNHNNTDMLITLIRNKVFPIKGLKDILMDSAANGYKSIAQEILKTNLLNYDIIKQAAIEAHKNHLGVYNLLRNHMRTLLAPQTPLPHAFYQPATHLQHFAPKESQRRIKRGR